LKEDRVKKWLERGALPTDVVRSLIRRTIPGVVEAREEHKKKKVLEARRKRKERAAKSPAKTTKTKAAKSK
jgi:ribosomal protein S16